MRPVTRIHEWFAARISWVQYPKVELLPVRHRNRWRDLSGKERAWLITAAVWCAVIVLARWGYSLSSN